MQVAEIWIPSCGFRLRATMCLLTGPGVVSSSRSSPLRCCAMTRHFRSASGAATDWTGRPDGAGFAGGRGIDRRWRLGRRVLGLPRKGQTSLAPLTPHREI